jgi:plasmid stability protein
MRAGEVVRESSAKSNAGKRLPLTRPSRCAINDSVDSRSGFKMASLLVRNIEGELIDKLKARAVRNRRSAEAEHREILRQALSAEPRQSFKEIAARLRAMTTGRRVTLSEVLQREGRDEH